MHVGLVHGEELTRSIIGLAMRVHSRLGPRLLESVYHQCLCYELSQAGLPFEQNVHLPIRYGDVEIESGYRADIVVHQEVILELKSVEKFNPLYEALLLTIFGLARAELDF